MRVALIGCSKTKRRPPDGGELPARELYGASPLFRKALAWSEAHCDLVLIASAKYGVIDPARPLPYYDTFIDSMPAAHRRDWGRQAASHLHCEMIPYLDRRPHTLVLLAGRSYIDELLPHRNFFKHHFDDRIEQPLKGLGIGARLHALGIDHG